MTAPIDRPWYHRPEWIIATVTVLLAILGGFTAVARGDAQTVQNTRDIAELKQQSATVPERLARIEQKVDDLKALEVRRRGDAP